MVLRWVAKIMKREKQKTYNSKTARERGGASMGADRWVLVASTPSTEKGNGFASRHSVDKKDKWSFCSDGWRSLGSWWPELCWQKGKGRTVGEAKTVIGEKFGGKDQIEKWGKWKQEARDFGLNVMHFLFFFLIKWDCHIGKGRAGDG